MRRLIAALVLVSFLAPLAHAEEPVTITVEPAKLDEGHLTNVTIAFTNATKSPLVFLDATAAFAGQRLALAPQVERGFLLHPLGRGAVTFKLTLSEGDLGPLGRGPMPPIEHELGREELRLFRVIAPGEKLALVLPASALAGRDSEVAVTFDVAPIEDVGEVLVDDGSAKIDVPSTSERQGSWPGPARVEVAVRRWRPWQSGAAAGEVLVGSALAPHPVARKVPLTVAAAPFSSKDALAKAGVPLDRIEQGATVGGVWAFDSSGGAGSVLVSPGGARMHPGRLVPLLHAIDKGEGHITLPGGEGDAPLVKALVEKGIEAAVYSGKPRATVRVRSEQIGDFVEILEKQDYVVNERLNVSKRDSSAPGPAGPGPAGPGPGPAPAGGQGAKIPCLECRVLRPGLEGCTACGGSGMQSFPARMLDKTGQQAMARERRATVNAILETGDASKEAIAELRRALGESHAYGNAWAAGYDGRPIPEDEAVANALRDAVRAELRLRVLELEAKAAKRDR